MHEYTHLVHPTCQDHLDQAGIYFTGCKVNGIGPVLKLTEFVQPDDLWNKSKACLETKHVKYPYRDRVGLSQRICSLAQAFVSSSSFSETLIPFMC